MRCGGQNLLTMVRLVDSEIRFTGLLLSSLDRAGRTDSNLLKAVGAVVVISMIQTPPCVAGVLED